MNCKVILIMLETVGTCSPWRDKFKVSMLACSLFFWAYVIMQDKWAKPASLPRQAQSRTMGFPVSSTPPSRQIQHTAVPLIGIVNYNVVVVSAEYYDNEYCNNLPLFLRLRALRRGVVIVRSRHFSQLSSSLALSLARNAPQRPDI
jgi:hypothetical protein